MGKKKRLPFMIIGICLFAFAVFWATQSVSVQSEEIELIPYTEYMELLENGDVNTIVYNDDNKYMTISLHTDETRAMSETERETAKYDNSLLRRVYYPEGDNFKKDLLERGVIVTEGGKSVNYLLRNYGDVLIYLILFAGLAVLVLRSAVVPAGGKIAELVDADKIDVSFDDVIGHEEIKDDLKLLVKQLSNGDKYQDISHGVLFEGSAGTGKTMLAKAIAHEAGVNFISVNSSSIVQMYVGLGAKRIRDVFSEARRNAPCVLFFDELDAIGEKRGSQRSHRENDQTINALLTEMDGFSNRGDILIIAATNRSGSLDDALVRSGRFDRKIVVDIPRNWETRERLFNHYLKDYNVSDDVDLASLAKQTVGFSGADIAALCRESRLVMFSKDMNEITQEHLEEALDKIVFKGNRSKAAPDPRDMEIKAYHEAGHAVMNMLCGRDVSRISIMGMTNGVGGAVFMADVNSTFQTKQDIETQIMICYAGRAAEEIMYGSEQVTNGASNDITRATELLSMYLGKYGFSKETGLIDLDELTTLMPSLNEGLVERMSRLSKDLYENTLEILKKNFGAVSSLANELIRVKTISGEEMKEIIGAFKPVM